MFHYQKKQFSFYRILRHKVLINFNFLHWILLSIDWHIPKLLFGSNLSDTYSIKFCDVFWRMNFSIFNKGDIFCSIGVQYEWNKIIMHLTVRLLMQFLRFKSKFSANIPLLEKMVFSLSNLRQQRLLNFSFNLNFLLRED